MFYFSLQMCIFLRIVYTTHTRTFVGREGSVTEYATMLHSVYFIAIICIVASPASIYSKHITYLYSI
jgi:hypothetical protein